MEPSPILIRAQLEKVLASKTLMRAGRLRRFLSFAVEQSLTGGQNGLKEYVVGVEVFEREPSYDPRIDPIVRVQARILRQKLEEYYATTGRLDDVLIEFPRGTYAPVFTMRNLPALTERVSSGTSVVGGIDGFLNMPTVRASKPVLYVAGIALAFAVIGGIIKFSPAHGSKTGSSHFPLRQLTFDSGLTTEPTLAPSGEFIAFASDRAGGDTLDIWLQQTASNNAVRLTSGAVSSREPSFSPDGTRIAFRVDGPNGGVFTMPALGGEAKLVAKEGREPRFSPDGRWLVYWTGEPHVYRSRDRKTFVVPAHGGIPRELKTPFSGASFATWLPDSKHLLIYGANPSDAQPGWHRVNLDDGDPVPGELHAVIFPPEMLSPPFGASASNIAVTTDSLVYSARQGDNVNLWRTAFSSGPWRPVGVPERLTLGSATEINPVAAGNRIAFVSVDMDSDIWSLPVDANKGVVKGRLKRIVQGEAPEWAPSSSAGGELLAFLSTRDGNSDVWILDRKTGSRRMLPDSSMSMSPRLSHDGRLIAYRAVVGGKANVRITGLSTGETIAVCDQPGSPLDWSADDRFVLMSSNTPKGASIFIWEIATGRRAAILNPPDGANLHWASLSHDSRWVVFHFLDARQRKVYVVPFRGLSPIAQSEWTAIPSDSRSDSCPRWSPDGKLVYFLSDRDGRFCIWAQRFSAGELLVGEPFPVHHFHADRLSLANLDNPGKSGFNVRRDELVFALGERKGNIWLLDQAAKP